MSGAIQGGHGNIKEFAETLKDARILWPEVDSDFMAEFILKNSLTSYNKMEKGSRMVM